MRFTLGITTKYIDRHPTVSMTNNPPTGISSEHPMTRVNSTNVLDEGLRIGEIGRRINSKVKSVKQGGYRK
jgi:hypothetical protein